MDTPPRRKTLSDEAAEAITERIIDGRLSAGTRLVVAALADELHLSATPINEALSALEREGLVSYAPHRGYAVREMNVEDIEEVFTVREAIEVMAVRLATERADAATLRSLEQLLGQAATAVKRREYTAFYELDMAFHRAILHAGGNLLAVRIAGMIHGQMHLLTAKAAYAPGRFKGAHLEHEAVLRCLRARDAAGAEAAMRVHIRQAKQALISAAREAQTTTPAAARPPRGRSKA